MPRCTYDSLNQLPWSDYFSIFLQGLLITNVRFQNRLGLVITHISKSDVPVMFEGLFNSQGHIGTGPQHCYLLE